jgi:hypothetical protein
MRILALEVENSEAKSEDFQPYLKAEAKKVWELQQEDFIREIYFRSDRSTAILMIESDSIEMAKDKLQQLPLVSNGLIDFELIPLKPYPGYSRLF